MDKILKDLLERRAGEFDIWMGSLAAMSDNIIMEADFYKQLSVAYKLNNNITKSETFAKKAEDLLKQND